LNFVEGVFSKESFAPVFFELSSPPVGHLIDPCRTHVTLGQVFALEVALDDRKPFKPQFSPEVTALLAQLHNDSAADDLNPACKRRSLADTKGVSKAVENNVLVMSTAKSHSNSSVSGCPGGQYQLMNFGPSGATKTCCPASSLACAGCASMSGSSCQQCQDGFVSRNGACIACSSGAWFNDQGKSCFHLVPSECNDVKVKGQSSNQACCQCGGGVLTPTPFSYPNVRWALDSEISILPEPRTAQRYTVDAACELSVHNLTMDSATGAISYISGLHGCHGIVIPVCMELVYISVF